MSHSYDNSISIQKLDLPKDRVNTQVQKLHQQGNDSAFRGEHLKHEYKAKIDFELAQEIQNQGLESVNKRDETGFYAEGLALYYMGQLEASKAILCQAALVSRKFKSAIFHQQVIFTIEALGMM